jgi:hypothetical protein
MTGKERFRTTFAHREPDRVPVSDQVVVSKVASGVLGRHAYTGGGEFSRDSIELLARGERDFLVGRFIEDTVELHRKLELDFVALTYRSPPKAYDRSKLPVKVGENEYRHEDPETGLFSVSRFSEESGLFFDIDSTFKQEGVEAIGRLIPSFERELAKPVSFADGVFDAWDGIARQVGNDLAIGFNAGIGFPPEPHWLEAILAKPSWAELYLDVQEHHALATIHESVRHGADFVLSECDLADNRGPFYNPDIYRKWLVPRYRRIVASAHEHGLLYIMRTDGNTRLLWKMMFDEIGVDGYEEIDREAGMDLGEMKRAVGKKITLIGNADAAKTLIYGDKDAIFKEVRECIRVAAPGGGYIMASSNSIHYNIPYRNFMYMVEAAKLYGAYPMSAGEG